MNKIALYRTIMATERDDRSNMPGEIGQNSRRRSREGDIGRTNGNGDVPRPFLIAVAGGTASGKSTVCDKIMDQLGQHDVDHRQRQVVTISQDSFYRSLTDEERLQADKGAYNFDHPAAFDDQLLLTTVKDIKEGKIIEIPEYDMKAHRRMEDNLKTVHAGTDVVIFEGILMLYFKEVRDLFNMKLFVDTDADTRLSRRVMRDVQERHRNLEKVLYQYTTFVKPAFEEFCLPTKKHADVIIPRGADNTVAIDLLVQHIQDLLKPNGHRRTGAANTRRTRTTSDSLLWFRNDDPVDEALLYASAH